MNAVALGTPSPLRATVVFLVAERGGCTPTQAAAMAGVSLPRARAYLVRLEHEGVLAFDPDHGWTPTPAWEAFSAEATRSRPRSGRFTSAEAYRDEREHRMALAKVVRLARGSLSLAKVAEKAGISKVTWWQVEHGLRTVEPETIQRMLRAARELRGGVWWE